ncbi:biotin-independent malonate decarboxylase subunit gamma [Roseomonas sp. HJA6]|uniref:Biotin-independent malonate decarboxylase subunit gamma n=1 Tax=Roseomonas alba TaxID=2846776 RepID=A0ABS7AG85_9PROT|nr:biotin-independent malonate decarboxylase subunit gamma [Neoroseomonas alba]MBW6401323.1 biotin-independent malonate decarboxylase subunit gamma [Neoroseomonas alba]
MTPDEILTALLPDGHMVQPGPFGTIDGTARVAGVGDVIGIVGGTPLGVDGALLLAGHVLDAVRAGGTEPIVVLVDTASQAMARREELLGLNEFLAHLAKSLALAAMQGHRSVSVLYGTAAAGAIIAAALSSQTLVALPDAAPSVMDLPSISRVTKLPLDRLESLAQSSPIFAPGVAPLFATGAVSEAWEAGEEFAARLAALLARDAPAADVRDQLGLERHGRLFAGEIARKVAEAAVHG